MPPWDAYKAEAAARGSLAFELYVVISTPAAAPEVMKETLPAHLAYQAEMEAAGSLVFAGPMSDVTGQDMQGMGLIVYRAASFETARAITDADPMHAKGARTYELRKWMINEGSLTVSVGLSAQTARLS
ncbi:YciI family protein [Jannaschia sp. 2305UL9-9]|uniref:YciI family protein n=1 Tax=Jannaschia sp. 2305UL9-9 TaxID=3121638 RepID=UPI003529B47C